jgi:hypothetical protein
MASSPPTPSPKRRRDAGYITGNPSVGFLLKASARRKMFINLSPID